MIIRAPGGAEIPLGEAAEILDRAQGRFFSIGEDARRGGFVGLDKVVPRTFQSIEEAFQNQSDVTGLRTGFRQMDSFTSGLQKGALLVLPARPSMGKTSFAMNVAENVAIKTGKGVAVFSMEMPGDALAMRMMSSLGRIDSHNLRTGRLDDHDWPRLISSVNMLSKAKLFIDDTPALTPTELRARTRRLKREHGLDLVVIDYLQLMQVSGTTENRATEISEISRSLKALAKELNVPVIALSQLNRSVEQRPDKRPVMSDLRESGVQSLLVEGGGATHAEFVRQGLADRAALFVSTRLLGSRGGTRSNSIETTGLTGWPRWNARARSSLVRSIRIGPL